jgi:hypothetical protein
MQRTKQLLPSDIAAHPTATAYVDLVDAYHFFNGRLFQGRLPGCIITLQRKARARGYFCGRRFGLRENSGVLDEIALNPQYFHRRTDAQILSTLVHEMVHLEQAHFGKPSRTGYHNSEWADWMKRIGLIPSTTGLPGGASTGPSVTHYIDNGGHFDLAARELLAGGRVVHVVDRVDPAAATAAIAKRKSKTAFACSACSATVWGKPTTKVVCGVCAKPMVSQ